MHIYVPGSEPPPLPPLPPPPTPRPPCKKGVGWGGWVVGVWLGVGLGLEGWFRVGLRWVFRVGLGFGLV